MFKLFNILILLIFYILSIGCTEKVHYSGKILNDSDFDYGNAKNKIELIEELGNPNYIDPIENKYYYFSEQKITKNFFNKKIVNRNMIIFAFDDLENIIKISKYNLDDTQKIEIINEKTEHELIKRGLIKKIFGGVGKSVPSDM